MAGFEKTGVERSAEVVPKPHTNLAISALVQQVGAGRPGELDNA
jgi:hypothetical protein